MRILKLSPVIFLKLVLVLGQISNCPSIFNYDETRDETQSNDNLNQWYGTLHIFRNVTLHGIYVDIVFDRQVNSVGTHFYAVTTNDNIEFHIEDGNYKLRVGETLDISFYVKFTRNSPVPGIREIRLNSQVICSSRQRVQQQQQQQQQPYYTQISTTYRNSNSNDDYASSSTKRTTNAPRSTSVNVNYDREDEEDRYAYSSQAPSVVEPVVREESSYVEERTTPLQNRRTTTQLPYFQGDLTYLTSAAAKTEKPKKMSPLDSCGQVIPKSKPLIVLGEETYRGQFPWHAAIYISNLSELKYICGGTLISKNAILTAAHCVAFARSSRHVNVDSLLVYLGKQNLRKWNGPEQDVKISEIIIHPEYDHERFYADIALVKFKSDVEITDYIRPACIWNSDSDIRNIINKTGVVPGWGYNEQGIVSEELSFVRMPVVSHETCIWSNRDLFSRITSDTSFCAGFKNGSSVCNGDSGGGLVFERGNSWQLRGIVSVSIALQNQFICDPKHYAVFTDVAKFSKWIADNQ